MPIIRYNSRVLSPWRIAEILGATVQLAPGPLPQFYRDGKPIVYLHREGLFQDFVGLLCLVEKESVPKEFQDELFLF